MEATVTIPDEVFLRAEQLAVALGLSRSSLYAKALSDFLRRQPQVITERLNALYDQVDSELDPALQQAQAANLPQERW